MDDPIDTVVERATSRYPECQSWSNQFRLRGREFELFIEAHPIPHARRILEVGCGTGIVAALLAPYADQLLVTDLPDPNPETTSSGLETPKRLLDGLEVRNYRMVACRGEALPFAKESVEVVFAGHTLEHIPDPLTALREMHRVLVRGGLLYLIMPSTMERLTYLPCFYQYLWRRGWWYASQRWRRSPDGMREDGPNGHPASPDAGPMTWAGFRRRHPHFPLPAPHGAYPHYLTEVVAYHPWRWQRLVRRAGFHLRKRLTTILFPYNLVGMFMEPFPWFVRWSAVARRIHGWPVCRSLGHNVCLVAQKV